MAAVLDALASYVKHMLMEMAKEEVSMLLGVSREINELEGKLLELKDVLADADKRCFTDKLVQRWVGVLKDAMYEATDILDLCKLKAEERQDSAMGGDSRRFNGILSCMRNPIFTHDIGSRIKKLNKRLDGICKSSQTFGFIRAVDERGGTEREVRPRPTATATDGGKTSPVMERFSLVGAKIEEDTMTLVDMLTKEGGPSRADDKTMMVVAISGIGGIGKTSLARNIYNHQTIGDKFKRIWLSVTHNEKCIELLLIEAIDQAREEQHCCHPHRVTSSSLLNPTLKNIISDKKVFLVLDDMWSAVKWNEHLKAPFSYAARGSRVLVTTRDNRVAREMNAQYIHRINFLGPQDAWSLLKKQVVATQRDMLEIETLKHIGFEILERCRGLPLAIKVIGGLLRQRGMNIVEWERVLNNPAWSIDGMPDELNHAIYLSYYDLPSYLKQCLLYCSFSPFPCHDPLVQMWISEGLVSSSHSDNLEEIGANYIEELTMRNLMEPNQKELGRQHCIIHDVVRSFCLYIARDEALVSEVGEADIVSRLGSQEFRVLSIGAKAGSGELEWNVLQKQRSLRTLITFCPIKFNPGDSLSRLSSLRTLAIRNADVSPLADTLSQLKHLRYLMITCPETSRLPDNIGKMRFLQHISLFGCVKMARLPSGIVKLKQLRYLCLLGTSINSVPRGFAALTNLRILSDFPAHVDGDSNGWCTLEELGPLSQLRNLWLKGLENVYPSFLATTASLCSKKHLVNLRLACSSRLGEEDVSEEEQRRIEEVFDELCPPSCINHLTIKSYFGRRLPNWMMSKRAELPLERLKFLSLQDLAFCSQLPDSLCQLPCLEMMEVRRAPAIERVGIEFLRCCNHPSRALGAFPRLNRLVMDRLVLWKTWKWEEQVEAMPVLQELVLNTCRLTCLPSGLAFHARALKILTLYKVHRLASLENLPSVVELDVSCCHEMTGIANLPSLHRLVIGCCPELQVVDGVPELRRLFHRGGRGSWAILPAYLVELDLAHLTLCCDLPLLCSMALGNNTPEWDKFRRIPRVEAFDINEKFRVSYTRDPRYLDTNISPLLLRIPRCRNCRVIHLQAGGEG